MPSTSSTSLNSSSSQNATLQGVQLDSPQSNITGNGTGSSMRMHPTLEGIPSFERPISGEDVSGNGDEETSNIHEQRNVETNGQWNGTHGKAIG